MILEEFFFKKMREKALSIQEKYLFLHTFSAKKRRQKEPKSFFHIMPV